MPDLSDIHVIHALLKRHGFSFQKSLGQNFLIDPSVCPRMAEACGADENTTVLEIGPGFGVLTAALAQRAAQVLSVEIDTRLLPVLEETLGAFDNVEVISGDVMALDLHALAERRPAGTRLAVCANLPYYITSPILMHLLESRLPAESITVMVQKEAADRLCAPVGSRAAGAVTVAVNYYAQAQVLFQVPSESFYPQPKVDSTVIRLDIRPEPAVRLEDEGFFFRVVRAAFGQRRKTALNAISAGLALPKEGVLAALTESGLDPTIRGEKLTMEQLATLAHHLQN